MSASDPVGPRRSGDGSSDALAAVGHVDRMQGPDAAELARRLRAGERDAADRLAGQLDTALEIALLAE